MTAHELIERVRAHGIAIMVDGPELVFQSSEQGVIDAVLGELRDNLIREKPEIITLLVAEHVGIAPGPGTRHAGGWTPSPRREGYCACDQQRAMPNSCLCPICAQVVASLEDPR